MTKDICKHSGYRITHNLVFDWELVLCLFLSNPPSTWPSTTVGLPEIQRNNNVNTWCTLRELAIYMCPTCLYQPCNVPIHFHIILLSQFHWSLPLIVFEVSLCFVVNQELELGIAWTGSKLSHWAYVYIVVNLHSCQVVVQGSIMQWGPALDVLTVNREFRWVVLCIKQK